LESLLNSTRNAIIYEEIAVGFHCNRFKAQTLRIFDGWIYHMVGIEKLMLFSGFDLGNKLKPRMSLIMSFLVILL
jgi:hypothetical protein